MQDILDGRNEEIVEINENLRNDFIENDKYISQITKSEVSIRLGKAEFNYKVLSISISELSDVLKDYTSSVVVVIGHGSEEGLIEDNEEYKRNDLNTLLENDENQLSLVVSCFGGKVIQNSSKIVGISSEVDNIAAGYLFSYSILNAYGDDDAAQDCLVNAMYRIQEIEGDPEKAKYLSYLTGKMGYKEALAAGIGIAVIIMIIATTIKLNKTCSKAITAWVVAKGIYSLYGVITKTIGYFNGKINGLELARQWAAFLLSTLSLILKYTVWYHYVFVVGCMTVHIASAGATLALQIIGALLTLVQIVLLTNQVIKDYNDSDDTPYYSWY